MNPVRERLSSVRTRWGLIRLASVMIVLVPVVASFGAGHPGAALGPIEAVTPNQTNPAMGQGRQPDISRRGEGVTAHDPERRVSTLVRRDTPPPEAPVGAGDMGVSGDGCVGAYPADIGGELTQLFIIDTCRGIGPTAISGTFKTGEGPFAQPSLDFDGSSVVLPSRLWIRHFDRSDGSVRELPVGSIAGARPAYIPNDADVEYNVADVSVDGSVVAATLTTRPMPSTTPPVVTLGPIPTITFVIPTFVIDGIALDAVTDPLVEQVAARTFTFVVSWDVGSPTLAVMSSPDGGVSGNSFHPSISGDGQHVAFASVDLLAGPATDTRGPWVYVRPRNAAAFTLVSPIDESSLYPTMTEDATQVAFVHTRPLCSAAAVIPGCSANPVEVVSAVWSSQAGMGGALQSQVINSDNDGRILGTHREPAISGNGRYVAWETNAGFQLVPGGTDNLQVLIRERDAGLAIDGINFGTIPAGATTAQPTTVRNTGTTSVMLTNVSAAGPGFAIQDFGSCPVGGWMPPGTTCQLNVRFTAPPPDQAAAGTVNVSESGFQALAASANLNGASQPTTTVSTTTTLPPTIGTPPSTTLPPTGDTPPPTTVPPGEGVVVLEAEPDPVDFGQVAIRIPTPTETITVTNTGTAIASPSYTISGTHGGDFEIFSRTCAEQLGPGASCTVDVRMRAQGGGDRTAQFTVSSGSASASVTLIGQGRFAPEIIAMPAAVTARGVTTIIGQGFPSDQTFSVEVAGSGAALSATSDAEGMFEVPLAVFGRVSLGTHVVGVPAEPSVFERVETSLIVVLDTFQPQGPTGPAFSNNLIVSRGG